MFSFRLSPELVQRIEALAARMSRDPKAAPLGRVSRSEVARQCLVEGLERLERRYPPGDD